MALDTVAVYAAIKYWAPILGFFGFLFTMTKGLKKNVNEWADKLLNNHMSHIQAATESTVAETKKTNALLASQSLQTVTVAEHVREVKTTLNEHNEKEMQVWNGIVQTLAILEDRSRSSRRTPRRK